VQVFGERNNCRACVEHDSAHPAFTHRVGQRLQAALAPQAGNGSGKGLAPERNRARAVVERGAQLKFVAASGFASRPGYEARVTDTHPFAFPRQQRAAEESVGRQTRPSVSGRIW